MNINKVIVTQQGVNTVMVSDRALVKVVKAGFQGVKGADGVGMPEGGTTGQTVVKRSNDDYDFGFSDAGSGDMTKAVYDPSNKASNAFDMANMVESTTNKILTSDERTKLTNLSGTNTGDQDLSGYVVTSDSRLSDARTPVSHDNTYHSASYITSSSVTYEQLNTNGDVGTTEGTLAIGNHNHSGVYAPALGDDDNYVTDAEKTKLSNLSGINTGDQDLSGYVPTSRTVNSKALTENITLTKADIGLGNVDDVKQLPNSYLETSITDSDTKVPSSQAVLEQSRKYEAINPQTGTTYTIVASDAGKIVTLSNESGVAVTLPTPTSLSLVAGTVVTFADIGAGASSLVAGEDAICTSRENALTSAGQGAIFFAIAISAIEWLISGDLVA